MKVKSYKIKEDTTIQKILGNGFEYSLDKKYLAKYIVLKSDITLYIKIPLTNILSFDDIKNVDVLDEEFLQTYYPFYDRYEEDVTDHKFLINVIERYNEEMDKISVFEFKGE